LLGAVGRSEKLGESRERNSANKCGLAQVFRPSGIRDLSDEKRGKSESEVSQPNRR